MPKPRICVKPKPTKPIIPNTPELPLDIIEVIIEKLCEDEPNLTSVKACCLVCYDFVDICRKRIFASISLSTVGPYGTPRPSNYFFWKQNGHVKKFNRLLTKAPLVAKYIREMEFDPYRDNMFFRAFLPHMDKINRLISFRSYGDFLQWDREYSCAPLLRIFQLPDLIALDLSAFCNFDLADLECCVKLEQLRFRTIQLYNYSPRLQCTRQSPLKLRGLSIGHASHGLAWTAYRSKLLMLMIFLF
ncbi:hypothetical protein BDN70DRAFT_360438 [Pholiota conissans]|uniref:F-box domain-containing protein n=1 Tax=Pholiota conissans TaxID=109636 RepID=A0A9P6CWM2_9AGAR|nr:hypothetical protein BDN70DRAFT_360438 [Pholiota conissans]